MNSPKRWLGRLYLTAFISSCMLCWSANGETDAPTAMQTNDFWFGVAGMAGDNKTTPQQLQEMLASIGGNSFRTGVYWSDVEKQQLVFAPNWRAQRAFDFIRSSYQLGLKPMVVLAYGNALYGGGLPATQASFEAYGRYCRYVAEQLKPYPVIFEIWNEWNYRLGDPNRSGNKGSAEDYVSLVEACSAQIRQVSSSSSIVVGATSGYDPSWTEEVLKLGVMNFADGYSMHPYTMHSPRYRKAEHAYNYVLKLRTLLGTNPKDIYISELGWPNSTDQYGFSDEESSNYLLRFYLLTRTVSEVKAIHYYQLVDKDSSKKTNKEFQFGLWYDDYSAKLNASLLQSLKHFSHDIESSTVTGELNGKWIVEYSLKTQGSVIAAWSDNPSETLVLEHSGDSQNVEFRLGPQVDFDDKIYLPLSSTPTIIQFKSGEYSILN